MNLLTGHQADGITGCWWYEYAEEDGKTYYSDGESWILFEDDRGILTLLNEKIDIYTVSML